MGKSIHTADTLGVPIFFFQVVFVVLLILSNRKSLLFLFRENMRLTHLLLDMCKYFLALPPTLSCAF